jgi:hypothetical protein
MRAKGMKSPLAVVPVIVPCVRHVPQVLLRSRLARPGGLLCDNPRGRLGESYGLRAVTDGQCVGEIVICAHEAQHAAQIHRLVTTYSVQNSISDTLRT